MLDRCFTTFDHLIKLYEKPESYSLSADNIVDLMYHLSELNTIEEPSDTAIDQNQLRKVKRNNKKLFCFRGMILLKDVEKTNQKFKTVIILYRSLERLKQMQTIPITYHFICRGY